jgi:pyrroloquinoline quinone biosynthesis protein D
MPSTGPIRTVSDAWRPRLAPHLRLEFDPVRGRYVLLGPETVSVLNGTGAAIVRRCDGRRTVAEIVAELRERYQRVVEDEVRHFLVRLADGRFLEVDRA